MYTEFFPHSLQNGLLSPSSPPDEAFCSCVLPTVCVTGAFSPGEMKDNFCSTNLNFQEGATVGINVIQVPNPGPINHSRGWGGEQQMVLAWCLPKEQTFVKEGMIPYRGCSHCGFVKQRKRKSHSVLL